MEYNRDLSEEDVLNSQMGIIDRVLPDPISVSLSSFATVINVLFS